MRGIDDGRNKNRRRHPAGALDSRPRGIDLIRATRHLVEPIVIVALAVFTLNSIVLAVLQESAYQFQNSYVNDLVMFPLMYSAFLFLEDLTGFNKKSSTLSWVVFWFALWSILFEVVFPIIFYWSTADVFDVLCYAVSALAYYACVQSSWKNKHIS